MSKEVSAALGTQRQFAKQPELPYALNLIVPNTSAGISSRVDLNADRLARSLGVFNANLQAEIKAQDKRERDQAVLVNADKMLLGKTKEDLQQFDRMSALQHQSDQFDLSDNPYAMAVLEKGIGKMASTYAKEQWADLPEAQRPKSVQEAVHQYGELLEQNRKDFGDNIQNVTAFDQGFYEGAASDTMKVASEAHARINDEKHYKMMMLANTGMQDLIYSGATGDAFNTQADMMVKQLELGSRDIKEFSKAMQGNLEVLASKDLDGSRLKQFEEMSAFGGSKLKDLISFAPYKRQIAKNCREEIARQSYEKYKLPNGGFNWAAYNRDKAKRPTEMFKDSIPSVDIPISEGDNPNLEGLSESMRGVIPQIGGVLFNLGFGDVMQLTSGYRTPEHNAEVGGAENSYHTTGDALDIYLGSDLSQDQLNQIQSTFAPYFGEVLFHDAGSGNHLHLASYKGGLDNKESKDDLSYAAYDTGRDKAIDSAIRTKVSDAQRQYRQEKQQMKNDVVSKMYQANSAEEASAIVDNSSLPPLEKQKLKNSLNKVFKARDAANKGLLKGDALKITNYEHPMSSTNVFKDMELAEEYRTRLDAHEKGEMDDKGKDTFTAEEQRKYNDAARRLCWYWSKVAGNQPKAQETPTPTQEYDVDTATNPTETPTTPTFTRELTEAINTLEAQNYSDAQIDAYIEKWAKKNNMDPEQVRKIYKGGK